MFFSASTRMRFCDSVRCCAQPFSQGEKTAWVSRYKTRPSVLHSTLTGARACTQAKASANSSPGPAAASRLRLPQKSSCSSSTSPASTTPAKRTSSPARSRNCPRRKPACRADRQGRMAAISSCVSPANSEHAESAGKTSISFSSFVGKTTYYFLIVSYTETRKSRRCAE